MTSEPSPAAQSFQQQMPDYQSMMDAQYARYQSEIESMRAEQAAAAEEYRRQADEQRRQFELAQRTAIGNEARAGQQADFKLGSDPGMKRGGTYGFRRRRRQALMGGINSAGMLNV
jgi:ATPase subunit of ABC transporter with duplicated ATPase domains